VNPSCVVITGIGVISPVGKSSKEMWSSLCAGRCGIGRITAFDPVGFSCKIAGEVRDFRVQDYIPKAFRKAVKLMSRDIELAIAAADEAFRDSGIVTKGIDPEKVNIDPCRVAINIGAGLISCDLEELAPSVANSATNGEFDIHKWGKDGLDLVTPLWLLKYLPNMLACHIGIIHDIQGPSNTITCSEASAHLSISEAYEVIMRGDSDIALAGAAEAKVCPMVIIRQCLLKRATSENNDNPAAACRPFDSNAKGSVFGEGAGMVVLESFENARNRGAKIYAQIAGTGQSTNLNSAQEHLEPDGKGIQIAIEKAMEEAQIGPEDLDLIVPHGTGIAADDLAEAKGIESALGNAVKKVPVWPTKSMISNTGAAAGGIDIAAAVCAIKEGKIPAAKNCDKKAGGCNLNIVTKGTEADLRYVLCCSYGFGQTAAIILKKFEGQAVN
jgi:3-oxoacyl-[acyl-carrier-protein] synthase II